MRNLRTAISVLFCRVDPEEVLEQVLSPASRDLSEIIDKDNIGAIFETINEGYTNDEINSVIKVIEDTWIQSPDNSVLNDCPRRNIFYLIYHFTAKVLMEKDGIPMCEFSQLLRWREISYQMSENFFTTAFYAYKDLTSKRKRHFFSWNPTIGTNNRYLLEILEKKCTDLHFHLWGSSLNFDINWLCLMNRISRRREEFEDLGKIKNTQIHVKYVSRQLSLYSLYVKAFAIRLLLFRLFVEKNEEDEGGLSMSDYRHILSMKSEEELCLYVAELQREADRFKYLYGSKYEGGCIDYAIPVNLSERNYAPESVYNISLYGERWLMYKAYKIIFSNQSRRSLIQPLFYAYLLIQNRIRKELIQLNSNPGFKNFQEYQDRKTIFIDKDALYSKLLVNLAINNVLHGQHVDYLEARITPKLSVIQNLEMIRDYDNIIHTVPFCPRTYSISEERSSYLARIKNKIYNKVYETPFTSDLGDINIDKRDKYHFIFHFIKKNGHCGKTARLLSYVKPRHYELRNEVKEKAMTINIVRRINSEMKRRIVGIDAASSEIGNRPEIFAQAFRYLKKYSHESKLHAVAEYQFKTLGYTYHVGEDFMDIVDGLRAIDEAVRFLNLGRGDRLGHALALGVNPKDYYGYRENKVILSRQDYLDNVVWLLITGRLYNVQIDPGLEQELNSIYHQLIHEIYDGSIYEQPDPHIEQIYYKRGENQNPIFSKKIFKEISAYSIPINSYYQSWLLRGDAPDIYMFDFQDIKKINHITYWDHCRVNTFTDEYEIARSNGLACAIYRAYHFSPEVIERGGETKEYRVSKLYIELVFRIQRQMQVDLARKHVAIESNPTSNKLIGCYKRYSDHPISRFFNLGLVSDSDKIADCPQLSVSINTDDLGVFSTNLENEYALMAIALEKMLDENDKPLYTSRMIYDWLDRIRQMGYEQRFH